MECNLAPGTYSSLRLQSNLIMDESARIAELLITSANTSKLRQHPTVHPQMIQLKKTIIDEEKADVEYREAHSERKRKGLDTDFCIQPIGFSSLQSLRLTSHQQVTHGKVKVCNFVGDAQASTSINMAHLFGAHGVPVVQAMGPDQPASRVINTSNDEVAKMAGIDAEAPLENLLAYIRQLANAKVLEARRKGKSSKLVHDLDGEAGSLMESFDDSALTAVGVLVEELVRDMMVQWYHTGAPVAFDGRALRTEVLTQMNGAPRPKEITPEVLRKRLEVLFGRDLIEYMNEIVLYHKIGKARGAQPTMMRRQRKAES